MQVTYNIAMLFYVVLIGALAFGAGFLSERYAIMANKNHAMITGGVVGVAASYFLYQKYKNTFV